MSNRLVWLDPSLENVNAGDEIIADSVSRNVPFADKAVRLTTHRLLRRPELDAVRKGETVFVGGTNIINSRLLYDRQWPMPPWQVAAMWHKLVFVGSGWWQYQRAPDRLTAHLFRAMSHPEIPHAVRDHYTAERFMDMGVPAIMTGCPTMWGLDGVASQLSPGDGPVVATITDYHLSPSEDMAWLRELGRVYSEVLVVGMGPGDEPAFRKFGSIANTRWFGVGTQGLAAARKHAKDFIGTRLHAAVRWLQMDGAALVLSVDNRAKEIGRDSGLPVVERGDLTGLQSMLSGIPKGRIAMPVDAIRAWNEIWRANVTTS